MPQSFPPHRPLHSILCVAVLTCASTASAVNSAELYTAEAYTYGRFDANLQFAPGDGVVSSFFLWKDGSEKPDVFWNELDFEKIQDECLLKTNALYGSPGANHNEAHDSDGDLCSTFHTYSYEWTPEYVAWFLDDVEIRRDTGDAATAFAENTADGM